MSVNFDQDFAYTASKDGSIFRSSLIDNNAIKVYQNESKIMITSLAVDQRNDKLWLGIPDSSTPCLDIKAPKN
jgi:hypothetical protein